MTFRLHLFVYPTISLLGESPREAYYIAYKHIKFYLNRVIKSRNRLVKNVKISVTANLKSSKCFWIEVKL